MTSLTANELATLKAARNCTDESGMPIMSNEAAVVVSLEKAGLIRIAGEHQNRVFILPAGEWALLSAEPSTVTGLARNSIQQRRRTPRE